MWTHLKSYTFYFVSLSKNEKTSGLSVSSAMECLTMKVNDNFYMACKVIKLSEHKVM